MDRVLLFSGGVDSVIAYFYLEKPKLLYVDVNSKYSEFEYKSVLKFLDYNETVPYIKKYRLDLSSFEQADANIPARNALLLTIGSYYGSDVCLVSQRGEDSGPDRARSFFKRMSQMLTDCHSKKIVCDPVFPGKTKQDMVSWFLKQKMPVEMLLNAYSCYAGQETACSTCPACFRKFISLEYNGIDTSSIINKDKLLNSRMTHDYIKKMTDHHNTYDRKRTRQTLKVLRKFGKK